ncbi:phage virion morphogenesis protein [Pseudoalteromonas caenipelagi]|uniref:phage virion morphogenesis protein n=1 Tax=Pseudoalteromonas caenipelagi TaxID=2726988 RepID=UPI001FEB5520|nr:phage virion morphogenesis protein [Pseudoalteromonas caenipelagi]
MTSKIAILTHGDATQVLNEIAAILEDATEDAFAQERSPVTGEAWLALSENYLN